MNSIFQELSETEIAKIKLLGREVVYPDNEKIFSEGDEADYLYFLKSGSVSIYIDKFNTRDEIRLVEPGDWFGEMAMFNENRRNANAVTLNETIFLSIPRHDFTNLLESENSIKKIIMASVDQRNMDQVLSEKLIETAGISGRDFHISIKGDPSLRESAMARGRYESIVDKNLPELVTVIEDLLLNRIVHRVMIGFNNGEIRMSSVLDPFSEEHHPAARLLDKSYIERHFPLMDYDEKAKLIGQVYKTIGESRLFSELPHHLGHGMNRYFTNWQPVPGGQVSHILSQLNLLRSIPNFYVRNMTVGILKDAIHMQFNCDGTHIVSSEGYKRFIAENL